MIEEIKKIEVQKLQSLLESYPPKKEILSNLKSEKARIKRRIANLKEPKKEYNNIEKLLQTQKYKNYNVNLEHYSETKNNLLKKIGEIDKKIKLIEKDEEYDLTRDKVMEIIPLIEKAKTIEAIANYTFSDKEKNKSVNKHLLSIFLLIQSAEIVKTDEDIRKLYKSLKTKSLAKKLEDLNLEKLFKSLKKINIEIDDGFIQFIVMIINEKSFCTKDNLVTTFPILEQLKEDKEVPKNIRVGLEILANNKNSKKTIHEIGCEILIKEVLYKIKENQYV